MARLRRLAADIQQLEAGRSEALTAYLNAMSRFHSYSFGNILEIARQKPDATRVAGFYAWNQLGRKVKKGERGIRILAPIVGVRRKPQEEVEKEVTKENRPVLVGFRNAYVFDVSQTEGAELPEMHQITGDVGDNRDRSADSRVLAQVGYVPAGNIIGKAEARFFSIKDNIPPWQLWQWPANIRWDRMLQSVYQNYTTTPAP